MPTHDPRQTGSAVLYQHADSDTAKPWNTQDTIPVPQNGVVEIPADLAGEISMVSVPEGKELVLSDKPQLGDGLQSEEVVIEGPANKFGLWNVDFNDKAYSALLRDKMDDGGETGRVKPVLEEKEEKPVDPGIEQIILVGSAALAGTAILIGFVSWLANGS